MKAGQLLRLKSEWWNSSSVSDDGVRMCIGQEPFIFLAKKHKEVKVLYGDKFFTFESFAVEPWQESELVKT